MLYVRHVKIPAREVQHLQKWYDMDILRVAQRILANAERGSIYADDVIDLGYKLDRLGVTKGTHAQYGIRPSLKLIGEALAFGEDRKMFEVLPATPANFSVLLSSTQQRTRRRSADELLSTPGMFVGTRGIEHILHHCRVQ